MSTPTFSRPRYKGAACLAKAARTTAVPLYQNTGNFSPRERYMTLRQPFRALLTCAWLARQLNMELCIYHE